MSKEQQLAYLNSFNKNTLMETLQIEYTNVGEDFIEASMPVNSRVHQPYGLLHGGASIALAETVGSILSAMDLDHGKYKAVGMQLSSNHLKSVTNGTVYAHAKFVKKGKRTHLIEITIKNEQQEIINKTMLTNAILTVNNA